MPRHRLPETDFLRFKALKSIAEAIRNDVSPDQYLSIGLIEKNQNYLNLMEKILEHNAINQKLRLENQKEYSNLFAKARIYILHYLQIINMSVERGEQPASVRHYYQLDEHSGKLPEILNESNLVTEALKLFEGDSKRTAEGGKYFTNPTIGLVKVWYDKFLEAQQKEKNLCFVKTGEVENIALLRKEIDNFVDTAWCTIESNASGRGYEEQLRICHIFGIEYDFTQSDILIPESNPAPKGNALNTISENSLQRNLFEHENQTEKVDHSNLQFMFEFPK